ncbi:HEPN domain-containing protein [Cytobacillus oceanisediminis]|uniref:ApeA N-terminal domain 1-containing protein n=1 Tax=Cytobacillus oceanisediminis TaxID=665099 RepID=UPI00207A0EBA|nr:HEPN domain-containing protein [Cytobacillus oceanisediminis]USK45806.1 hypothetical protein LIT27_08140 [Cytobacillus oceanisediminis]
MAKKNFSMYDEFEFRGYWYLPSNPDNKVAGVLSFSMEGIDLELFGTLHDDLGMSKAIDVEVILGDCEENITLLNGFQTRFTVGKQTSSEYTFNRMIIGKHFNNIEEIQFYSISVNYSYMEEWMGYHPFVDTHEFDEENKTKVTKVGTSYTFPPIFTVDVPSIEAEVKADYLFNTRGEQYKTRTFEHSGYLSIRPYKEQTLSWFLDKVSSLQDLISLVMDFPVYPMRIRAKGEIVNEKHNYRENIQIFLLPLDEYFRRKIKAQDMLFRLPEIEGKIDMLLNKWFENKTNPAYKLYLENVYSNVNNPNVAFVNYTKALESFHRKTTEDNGKYVDDEEYEKVKEEIIKSLPRDLNGDLKTSIINSFQYAHHFSFRKRVKEMTREMDEKVNNLVLGEIKLSEFAGLVVDNRNYYTHYDNKPKNLLTGWDLDTLSNKVKVIVVYHLLKMIGIDDELFLNSITGSKLERKLKRDIEALKLHDSN